MTATKYLETKVLESAANLCRTYCYLINDHCEAKDCPDRIFEPPADRVIKNGEE